MVRVYDSLVVSNADGPISVSDCCAGTPRSPAGKKPGDVLFLSKTECLRSRSSEGWTNIKWEILCLHLMGNKMKPLLPEASLFAVPSLCLSVSVC